MGTFAVHNQHLRCWTFLGLASLAATILMWKVDNVRLQGTRIFFCENCDKQSFFMNTTSKSSSDFAKLDKNKANAKA